MTSPSSEIQKYIADATEVLDKLARREGENLLAISHKLVETFEKGGKVYICGNGGSAADAQHVAAELVGRFRRNREALPVIALTTNVSTLTAVANDFSFEEVFARQVKGLVTAGDVLVAISTSGQSKNILNALEAARQKGASVIGFTGEPGEPLCSEVDLCLKIPSSLTSHIQEGHIVSWHIICDFVEKKMEPSQKSSKKILENL